ncbi:sigma-70 family RNA polymerase sigma factor [Acutalibacter sp. 1XD8-33]|nr:sigma-70 family RNA polymerase sigma factor [Acutalibacter sp. 1XD8-33]RKJ39192.1 sigma-70 family RNA polymerase sigma factor [Acutalibacter sp. 1XD8-33]
MRNEQEARRAMEQYADTVWRLCLLHVKNRADAEDVFQTVFLKYTLSSVMFENEEHEKAWFIRVTTNACKDFLKSFFRSHTIPIDEIANLPANAMESYREVLDAVLSLPAKYRDAVYLHYYEGYTAPEIGRILKKKTNSVYTLLNRSKKLLAEKLGGDGYE